MLNDNDKVYGIIESEKEVNFITTTDNPYDPSTNFDEWFAFDTINNYCTCNLLDRMYQNLIEDSSYEKLLKNEDDIYLDAMKRIVEMGPGLYKILTKTIKVKEIEYDPSL